MKEREAKVELVAYEMGITNIYNQEHSRWQWKMRPIYN